MRAFALFGGELQLGLADVGTDVEHAVQALGFGRRGAISMRAFPAGASYAAAAGARFEIHAESMVRQAAGLDPAPWEDALATLVDRAGTRDWWLAGSAALAVRGLAVAPRDIDLIADAAACDRLAAALADLLVEPLTAGGYLGKRWFRGFAGARFECVGGVHPTVDDDEPSDFGPYAAARLETVEWNGHALRLPPLDLQLRASERRGLTERAALIRDAL